MLQMPGHCLKIAGKSRDCAVWTTSGTEQIKQVANEEMFGIHVLIRTKLRTGEN